MSTIATLLLTWLSEHSWIEAYLEGVANSHLSFPLAVPDRTNAWAATRAINGSDKATTANNAKSLQMPSETSPGTEENKEKEPTAGAIDAPLPSADDFPSDDDGNAGMDRDALQRVFKRAAWISGTMSLIITIVSCSRRGNARRSRERS